MLHGDGVIVMTAAVARDLANELLSFAAAIASPATESETT
jgi:hypothetical protein